MGALADEVKPGVPAGDQRRGRSGLISICLCQLKKCKTFKLWYHFQSSGPKSTLITSPPKSIQEYEPDSPNFFEDDIEDEMDKEEDLAMAC